MPYIYCQPCLPHVKRSIVLYLTSFTSKLYLNRFPTAPSDPNLLACTWALHFPRREVNLLHRDEVMDPVLSSKPNCLSGSVIRQVGRFHNEPKASMVSLISLKSRFLDLNRRIRSLETINNSLRAENAAVRAEIAVLGDEPSEASRASLCAEVEQRRKDALCMEQADEKIHRLVTPSSSILQTSSTSWAEIGDKQTDLPWRTFQHVNC